MTSLKDGRTQMSIFVECVNEKNSAKNHKTAFLHSDHFELALLKRRLVSQNFFLENPDWRREPILTNFFFLCTFFLISLLSLNIRNIKNVWTIKWPSLIARKTKAGIAPVFPSLSWFLAIKLITLNIYFPGSNKSLKIKEE